MSKIQEILIQKKINDEEMLMLMAKINEKEKIYFNCKKEIQTQKSIELSRISEEFMKNDFERRYNVTKDIVVSSICGEDNMNQEMSRLKREEKVGIFLFYFFISLVIL